jgi:hypothetical protein
MISKNWRCVYESVAGTSHIKSGLPCQDSSKCQTIYTINKEPVLVAIASDGAGSAKHAETGSRHVCSHLMGDIAQLFDGGGNVCDINEVFAKQWLRSVQISIAQMAEANELTSRDYACTVLVAVIGIDCAVFFQLGDGAIVISDLEFDEYDCVFWPQKGEYENTTFFITDLFAYEQLNYRFIEKQVEEIAVFTDGLQMIALHYQSQKAHSPFFRPIFEHLSKTNIDSLNDFSTMLRSFLNSDQVNDRTDDDKTLILATRKNT